MSDNRLILDVPIVDSIKSSESKSEAEQSKESKRAPVSDIDKAEEKVRKAKEEAYQEGLTKGIEEGIQKGLLQAEESLDGRQVTAIETLEAEKEQLTQVLTQLNELIGELKSEREIFANKVNEAAFSISSKLVTDLFMKFIANDASIKKTIDLMTAEHFGDLNVQVFVGKGIVKQLKNSEHEFLTSSNIGDWEIELSQKGQTILIDYQNYFAKLSEFFK